MRLEDKVAFISGGARGMGVAEARLFAKEGARVAIGDVLEKEGRQAEAEINETGEALFVPLDVTSEGSWREAIAATVARFGKVNVLVNNAGILPEFRPVDELPVEEWDRVMDINANGVFLGTKVVIPEMRKAGGGSIINISSISGMVGQDGIQAGYNSSKGAVRIFTKAAAIQYAKEGIRVNSVHPGAIETQMTESQRNDPEGDKVIPVVPAGRYGQPEEVAYGVLYLASDESSYVTGSELVIDGGWTAQ